MVIKFSNTPSDFALTLKKAVHDYFENAKIKQSGNYKLYTKTIVLFLALAVIYALLITINMPLWVLLPLSALFGVIIAAIGFNVMHDGAHGSYSQKSWVNDIMSYSLNLMGCSSYFWKHKHNVMHHSFTNIEGHDDDIDIRPFIRTNEHQEIKWYHRYQHIYWVFLYCLTYLNWIFVGDFKKYFTREISGRKIKPMTASEHTMFWFTKVFHIFLFIVLPIFMLGVVKAVLFYLITAFICGWVISVVFQLAHVLEDTAFPVPAENSNKIEENWMIHQLNTTANFSTKSKIVSWFTGGLNFQVEHHLFPKISHIHYPQINKLVKKICKQHNVPYVEHPTVFSAIKSHVKYLKTVGVTA